MIRSHIPYNIVAVVLLSLSMNSDGFAQSYLYSVRWEKVDTERTKWAAGVTKQQLEAFIGERKNSYRLAHLSAFTHQGTTRFCAVMEPGNDGAWTWHDQLTRAQLNTFINVTHKGKELVMFNGYPSGGDIYYTVLMRNRPSKVFRWEESMTQQEVNKFINVTGKGWSLTHLYAYPANGQVRYDAIIKSGRSRIDWEEQLDVAGINRFVKKYGTAVPRRMNGYRVNGALKFASFIDVDRKALFRWEEAISFDKLKALDVELRAAGYRLKMLNGVSQ